MSRRNLLPKYQVFDQEDTTTDPQSEPTDVSGVDFITYEIKVDVSVDALIDVYYCNDHKFNQANAKKLAFTNQPVLQGASDQDCTIHINNLGFKWLYLKITDNGGSGDIDSWVSGAGRGA